MRIADRNGNAQRRARNIYIGSSPNIEGQHAATTLTPEPPPSERVLRISTAAARKT